jgi:Fur family ferric uptake transcriptional regulator
MGMMEKARRHTPQKTAVQAALERSAHFISAQELFGRLRAEGSPIGLATVYRNLNELVEAGAADVLQGDAGEQLFRSCGDAHHHHLVCVDCGRTVEIDPPSEEWVQQAAADHGFVLVRHVLDVFGRCSDCEAARAQLAQ